MRERLVAAFVGLTVLVVALYGIPRAYFLADLVRSDEQARVDRTADVLAALLDERLADDRVVTPAYLDGLSGPGEWLTVSGLPSGDVVETTGDPGSLDGAVEARRDLAEGGQVTVTRTGSAVGSAIGQALLPLVLLGLLLAALAALVGFLLAARLARPFRELAGVARGLGEGRLHPDVPRYGVPEADAIGQALREAGTRLDVLLSRERRVAVHASHELRTPVTALRLELEDLALWPETPPDVTSALHRGVAELDRLSTAITDLLTLADSHRSATEIDVDLDALLLDAAARRRGEGLRVVHEPADEARTHLDPLPVVQALDLLVDELVAAGAEEVRLSVATRAGHFELRVAGEPTVAPTTDVDGDAARLARAGDHAVAAGGQVARDGATLVLRLPRRVPLQTPHSAQ